jgi:hypothetical protein
VSFCIGNGLNNFEQLYEYIKIFNPNYENSVTWKIWFERIMATWKYIKYNRNFCYAPDHAKIMNEFNYYCMKKKIVIFFNGNGKMYGGIIIIIITDLKSQTVLLNRRHKNVLYFFFKLNKSQHN